MNNAIAFVALSASVAIWLVAAPANAQTQTIRYTADNATVFLETGEFWRQPAPAETTGSKVTLRADGTTLVNGKPFLPFGFFISGGTAEDKRRVVGQIGAAGFNTIYADVDLLNEAARQGLKVFAYSNDEKIIKANKNHPALLGWAIADDVHNGASGTPDDVRALSAEVKTWDANHLTSTPLYDETFHISAKTRKAAPEATRKYLNVSDIIALQLYPIDNPYTQPEFSNIGQTELMLQNVEKGNVKNVPVWALPQSFAWDTERRNPTPQEARNQVYTSLINGAKGIVAFAYFWHADNWQGKPYTWDLGDPKNKVLWDGYKSLVSELKRLEPALLDGKRVKILSGDVAAAHWTTTNSVYIAVANESPTKAAKVRVPLPDGVQGPLRPVFDGKPKGLRLERNFLNGTLAPAEVHVYVLKRGGE